MVFGDGGILLKNPRFREEVSLAFNKASVDRLVVMRSEIMGGEVKRAPSNLKCTESPKNANAEVW